MANKLTKAERYKRNYALIRNTYQNPDLAKHARTWGADRLWNELGVKVPEYKAGKEIELKEIRPKQQAYYDRKLANFLYARGKNADVKTAKKVAKYKKKKIDAAIQLSKTRGKTATKDQSVKLTNKQRMQRMDQWSEWSQGGNYFPPEIEKNARDINRKTNVGGKQLDDYAKYGFVIEFYRHVEGKSLDEIMKMVKQDPHDPHRVINNYYRTEARAT